MKKPVEISVLIPTYKDTKLEILTAIQKIKQFLKKNRISYEIIISQNGSPDSGYLKIEDPSVHILSTEKKGLGIALQRAILCSKGKYFYFMPADNPFHFTDLVEMLHLFPQYDLLIGSKLHPNSIYKISIGRKILSYFQFLCTALLFPELKVRDVNGTLFANTDKARHIINSNVMDNSYFFSFQLVYLFRIHKLLISEVPVTYIKSNNKSSLNLFTDTLRYFISLIILRFHVPVKGAV